MITRVTTEVRLPPRFKSVSSPAAQKTQHASGRQHSLVIWITLIGIIFIPQMLIPLGGINVTPGRFILMLLLVPALVTLLKRGRNRVAPDFFAVALAAWIPGSTIFNGGFTPYVAAEALEFLGAYMVGRAFVFGPSNVRTFVNALKPITVMLIAIALLDPLSGRNITLEIFGIPHAAVVRLGWVRAASVFEGAEHYGTFCVAATAIFLYSERKVIYASLSFLGTLLSLSSGPFMGLAIVMVIFCYDSILKQYPWRWKALTTAIFGFLLFIFLFFDQPVAWLIVHLTLDPQTGFFRLGTWNAALPLIGQYLFAGQGLAGGAPRIGPPLDVFLSSVDCVWLVEALRYGLTWVILLILTMFSPFLRRRGRSTFDSSKDYVRTGFSLAVVTIGFIGLTVHYWDATWLFWSLCIGIRASFVEYELDSNHR